MGDAIWRSYGGKAAENRRLLILRILLSLTVLLGLNYVGWRWLASVNWHNWWIAVPLVLAETYSLVDLGLFAMTVWRARQRPDPPPAPPGLPVDVFVPCYSEPDDLIIRTTAAARDISYPHQLSTSDLASR